ncbi:hypothetical protein [Streptomyces sp. 8N616]|uniref:hypothetical protein n=1 Tax=Streptomyces sp. 8N616 TaxID=3457414 RepID=UPI003FD0F1C9
MRGYPAALRPHSAEGGYVNFMDHDDRDRVRVNYRRNYDRLPRSSAATTPATSSA